VPVNSHIFSLKAVIMFFRITPSILIYELCTVPAIWLLEYNDFKLLEQNGFIRKPMMETATPNVSIICGNSTGLDSLLFSKISHLHFEIVTYDSVVRQDVSKISISVYSNLHLVFIMA